MVKCIEFMEIPQNSQKSTSYTYTQPVSGTQPQVVYVQNKKNKGWFFYLLGCVGCFALIAFSCLFLVLLINIISSGSTRFSGKNSSDNIDEVTLGNYGESNSMQSSKIAVIDITGEITYSLPGEESNAGANSDNIISQLKKAGDDSSINAVILRFNTPGGETTASEPICREIKNLNFKKPVYSFIDSMGASLGYLLPNCTKYIIARPASITGSIGVIIQAVDFYGVLEKLGGNVIFVTNTAGSQKTGQDIFVKGSETYNTYQKILDENYEYFLNRVYEGRKLNHPNISMDKLRTYADGRIFTGPQAKDIDLVDEIGEFDQAINSIIEKENLSGNKVEIVEYQITSSPFSQLFGGLTASLNNANIADRITHSETKVLMKTGIINSKPQE